MKKRASKKSPKKASSWLANIVLLFFSTFLVTLLVFTALEIVPGLPKKLHLERIAYYSLKGHYLQDPDLVFRNLPGLQYNGYFTGDIQGLSKKPVPLPYQAAFDEEGFRNQGRPGNADIVVLGDSFIQFGLNEEDTFARRLEKSSGHTTANYGTEWYGPPQYLETFKKFALKRNPKIALFCFFEGNDPRDILHYLNWKKGGSYYYFNAHSKNFFQRYLFALHDVLWFTAKTFLKNWDPRKVEIGLGGETIETVFMYEVDPRSPEQILQSTEGLKLKETLESFKKIAEERKILPVVLFIPTSTHIYLPYAQEKGWKQKFSHEEQMKARVHLEEAVTNLTQQLGM
jgi:hypothetical protein